ncbi:VOC family protein [Aeromonas schubertii]|uniref:VOC domain-containing protein n=1 Tax=Aeromonas schubertii TaxID=652 RepID=A0A0S2SN33_9GAMM|nr:VOC family protein [Aeromonas schubertii]ALP43084.1 hypothetical protein WL1483_3665 [Aeromonas schubertii]
MIHAIDHFTLRTRDLDQTLAFYRDRLGLEEGARPPFPFPGHWLYSQGRPLLHLLPVTEEKGLTDYLGYRPGLSGSGAIDHISLRAEGLAAMTARLEAHHTPYTRRLVPELKEWQLFLEDNNGVTIELIFTAREATCSSDSESPISPFTI